MLCEGPVDTSIPLNSFLPTPADHELERRVTSFLASQHHYALRLLNVAARSGVVTLGGVLSTFYEKQIATQFVLRVAGVIRLIDEVIVPSPPSSC